MASLSALLSTLLTAQLPSSDPTPTSLRSQTATLFDSLPHPSLPLLALYAAAYQHSNSLLVSSRFSRALREDDTLLGEIEDIAVASLESDPPLSLSPSRVRMHLCLARSCEEVSSVYGQSVGVLRSFDKWWEMGEVRDEVVNTLFVLLRCAFLDPLRGEEGEDRDAFWEEMEDVVSACREDGPSGSAVDEGIGGGMWDEVERRFEVGKMIEEIAGQSEIARELAQTFRSFSPSLSSVSSPEDIELQISQILDVLPDLPSPFLRACLLHSHFSSTPSLSTPERVLGALLEGSTLPIELSNLRDGIEPTGRNEKGKGKEGVIVEKIQTRHNIYDDQRITVDKLLRPNAAPSTAMGVSTNASLRDLIIARAEAPSSDEEEEGETGEAFLEDFEDRTRAFRMTPDWGDEDTGTITPEKRESTSPITPALASILEQAYVQDPSLFNTDAVTRKSKKRVELRELTKLDDGILEGWRIMLERSDKKDKILEKHSFMNSFTGNEQGLFIPGTTGSHRGRGGSRGGGGESGRGGAGRGRGDGGRKAHDRRQRGNDRKQPKIV